MRNFAKSLLIIVASVLSIQSWAVLLNIDPSTVNAKAWLVYDLQTGQIISEHDSNERRAPASLTKMMTAYLILSDIKAGKLDLNTQITATDVIKQVRSDETSLHLQVGEKVSVETLLTAIVVISANDAALLMAEYLSDGVDDVFINRMNETAKQLGMTATHFKNPTGITTENHYSTAMDMNRLAAALIHDTPEYLHYAKIRSLSHHNKLYPATNILLERDAKVDGLKTGSTAAAGYNLVISAVQPKSDTALERRLLVTVLGAPSIEMRAKIGQQLLNLAYTYTTNDKLINKGDVLAELPIINAAQKTLPVMATHDRLYTGALYEGGMIDLNNFDVTKNRLIINGSEIAPLTKSTLKLSATPVHTSLKAPLHALNKHLIDLRVTSGDELLDTVAVHQSIDIYEPSLWEKIKRWLCLT